MKGWDFGPLDSGPALMCSFQQARLGYRSFEERSGSDAFCPFHQAVLKWWDFGSLKLSAAAFWSLHQAVLKGRDFGPLKAVRL